LFLALSKVINTFYKKVIYSEKVIYLFQKNYCELNFFTYYFAKINLPFSKIILLLSVLRYTFGALRLIEIYELRWKICAWQSQSFTVTYCSIFYNFDVYTCMWNVRNHWGILLDWVPRAISLHPRGTNSDGIDTRWRWRRISKI